MIHAIIVDDMPVQRGILLNLLTENHPEINVVAESSSVDEGIAAIIKHHPELVFLDVEMPGKTGFDLVSELHDIAYDISIIFTTAHEHYALKAIKASALDFILKPISEKDLNEALSRFEKKKTKDQVAQQIQVLLHHHANAAMINPANLRLALPTQTGFIFINLNEIVRCEADNVYTTFYMADKTKIVVSKTLKDCEELLPDSIFFRVHHSHLINMQYIKEYNKGEGGTVMMMNDNILIPVSRGKKEDFLLKMKQKHF